jgi:hypothetical protein
MHRAPFTFVERLWLRENLPFSSAVAADVRSLSGAYQVQRTLVAGDLKRTEPLTINAREFEMDCAHLTVGSCRGCSGLLGQAPPVIKQISFHNRHPAWLRRSEGGSSRWAEVIHILLSAALIH